MKQVKYPLLFLITIILNTNSIAQILELDTTFDPGVGFNSYVKTCAIQANGKILVGGAALPYVGYQHQGLARFNADGSFDSTFSSSLSFTDASYNYVACLVIQPDQKIIVGGTFLKVEGISKSCIVRLNSNGTIDTTFNTGLGANGTVSDAALQLDGKLVIGGNFTTYDGISRNRIARINSNGTIDTTFNPGNGFQNNPTFIYAVAIQPDNKILVGGTFHIFNGDTINNLIRLNSNGSLDTTFNQGGSGITGTGANVAVRKIVLNENDKIYIVGRFNELNDSIYTNKNITRLNLDGSLDTTFSNSGGTDNDVFDMALQPNGKIVIVGEFNNYYAIDTINFYQYPIAREKIARLNNDGSLDLTFDPVYGPNNLIRTIALQDDEKIIIGGSFLSYSGITRNRIARLVMVDNTGLNSNKIERAIQIFPNPASDKITILSTKRFNNQLVMNFYDLTGRLGLSVNLNGFEADTKQTVDLSTLPKGIYIVEVNTMTSLTIEKLIKN
jgi:uncharacterized delta-60 repeat protein